MSDNKTESKNVETNTPSDTKESGPDENTVININEPKDELEEIKAKLANAEKEYLYLRAEFDNFRKQSIKERSDLLKFGGEPLARDLLNVRDVFQKALELNVTPENFQAFLNGVEMTEKELSTVFAKHGIFEIECKEKPFDPEKAEALSQIPTTDVPEGFVYDVMRKGYLYHDKVLRHAQVVIATKPS